MRPESWAHLVRSVASLEEAARSMSSSAAPAPQQWTRMAANLDKLNRVLRTLSARDNEAEPDGHVLLRDARSRATLDALLKRLEKGN